MKQTVVELLIEQIKIKADNIPTNTKENRIVKGIYVDCLLMAKQAKEIEKEILKNAWETSEKNMRATFSNSTHKGVTFEQYYNQLKK